MSFTTDKIGEPIAKIINSKSRNKIIRFLGLGKEDEELDTEYKSIKLKDKEEFQIVPNTEKERQVGYITGQSGSGKTTFVINYCKEYKKLFPENPIYLFSAIKHEGDDDPYNAINPDRLRISQELETLDAKDFDNCLVIFDDMDCFKDKKLMKIVEKLRDEMLETGRHNKTYVLITYHLPTNGHDTRRMINEASFVVYFPKVSNGKIKNLLENYLGMESNQRKKIKKMRTRWACVMRTTPNIVITQQEMFILDEDDD